MTQAKIDDLITTNKFANSSKSTCPRCNSDKLIREEEDVYDGSSISMFDGKSFRQDIEKIEFKVCFVCGFNLAKDKKPKLFVRILKIFLTNWIHLLGFYATTYLSSILFTLLGIERYSTDLTAESLIAWLFTVPILLFAYGAMFLGGFYVSLLFLDSFIFNILTKKVRIALLIEWIIIIQPFIYWAFKYDYWLWLTLAISFLITQFIREKKIIRIMANGNIDK